MPQTVAHVRSFTSTDPVYFLLPSFGDALMLQDIFISTNAAANNSGTLWFGLTAGNGETADAMAAAQRLFERGNTLTDGKPTLRYAHGANGHFTQTYPIWHKLQNRGLSLLCGVDSTVLTALTITIIATLLFAEDFAAQFTTGRIIQTAGVGTGRIADVAGVAPQGQ